MSLTEENYYSLETDKKYLSNSQIKMFQNCEYQAMKYLEGEYKVETTEAMLRGSYVDEALTGTKESFEKFCKEHEAELFSSRGATKGLLKSTFQRCNQMIDRVKKDKTFMYYLSGQHQTIMEGNLFGVPTKIKMDSYFPGKMIVDLKTTESFKKGFYNPSNRQYENFIEHFNYIQQMAIYQEIVFQNTGEKLPCFIAAITTESVTDYDIFYIPNEELHTYLFGSEFEEGLGNTIQRIQALKNKEIEPQKCNCCESCLNDKVFEKPKLYTEVLGEI